MLNENIYITSNIIIRNNKTYYLDDKEIKITKETWSKYLEEYGWQCIDEEWNNRLIQKNKFLLSDYLIVEEKETVFFYVLVKQ